MKIIDELRLKVPSDLKILDQILRELQTLNYRFLPYRFWLECQLALVEGFANAVRHAHKNLSTEIIIEIHFTIFINRVELEIWDYGNPFDLRAFMAKVKKKSIFNLFLSISIPPNPPFKGGILFPHFCKKSILVLWFNKSKNHGDRKNSIEKHYYRYRGNQNRIFTPTT